jgi:nitroimidazol reductase NimA-like FMN-containing flavoprotein (pyridoxamine 5'-phosphate oxidase superfamily)
MGENAESIEETLRALFGTQRLAVLSTQGSGQPYASLVAFVASDDLKYLYFATARTTRKYHHLDVDPRVAMLMDSRSNLESDIHTAIAVTATGRAVEVIDTERDLGVRLYLSKHPYLQDFVRAQSCALIRVEVDTYYLVSRFQHVMELHILP